MNQRQIGAIILIIGVVLSVFLFIAKVREDKYIRSIIDQQGGVCYVDGICLHETEFTIYYIAAVLPLALMILGIYLLFFDKTQKILFQQNKEVSTALKEAREKDAFQSYLAGFSEEEQKVLKAVHEQEGIQQSTLRYRTGIAKTSLSLLLKSLEERGIITKKEYGKTNQVFLVKKF